MDNSFTKSLMWTFVHVLLFSCSAVVVKAASDQVPVAQQIFARALVALAILVASTPKSVWASLVGPERWLLSARGVLGFIGVYGTFYSLTTLPIPIAMMIVGTTPLLVLFLGALLLRETFRPEIVAYAIGIAVAIYFVTERSTPDAVLPPLEFAALLVAIGSAFATALAFITVKVAVRKVGTPAVVFWFAAYNLIGAAAIGGFPSDLIAGSQSSLVLVLLVCLLGVGSDVTKTNAYKYGEAWFVSLVSVSTIGVSGILAWAILGDTISINQWLWIGVMAGLLAIAIIRSRGAPTASAIAPTPQQIGR